MTACTARPWGERRIVTTLSRPRRSSLLTQLLLSAELCGLTLHLKRPIYASRLQIWRKSQKRRWRKCRVMFNIQAQHQIRGKKREFSSPPLSLLSLLILLPSGQQQPPCPPFFVLQDINRFPTRCFRWHPSVNLRVWTSPNTSLLRQTSSSCSLFSSHSQLCSLECDKTKSCVKLSPWITGVTQKLSCRQVPSPQSCKAYCAGGI